MKIGVALSGCDIGGVFAYAALEELENRGIRASMIAACGLPSVSALPYAYGARTEDCRALAERFLETAGRRDPAAALAELAPGLTLDKAGRRVPVTIGAVDVADGRICAFTDDYAFEGERLTTFPPENVCDMLSAALSPANGLSSFPYAGLRLCDYSVWYGCPVQPLRLAGMERVVSVAFVPVSPATPYQALVKQRIAASAGLADAHVSVEPDGAEESAGYIALASGAVSARVRELCAKLLF